MAEIARIGIAISEDLLKEFDDLIAKRSYINAYNGDPTAFSQDPVAADRL